MDNQRRAANNVTTSIILNITTMLTGFVVQRVFVQQLGIEYAGLKNVLQNIINVLTLADVGISSVVMFHLYEPLAQKNFKRVAALASFYKKAMRIVAVVIVGLALLALPFLGFIVGDTVVGANLYAIFLLMTLNAAIVSTMAYRRVVLLADCSIYVPNLFNIAAVVIISTAQIALLLFTQNFYLFLLAVTVVRFTEFALLNRFANRRYEFLHEARPLDIETRREIVRKMKASAVHNTASYIVFSTDSLIITRIFGVATVGLWANYILVLEAFRALMSQVFISLTANVGHIIKKDDKKRLRIIVKKLYLANSFLYATVAIGFIYCIQPFVQMWLGDDFLLPDMIVYLMAISIFVMGLRHTPALVLSAGNVVHENRFIPVLEVLINLFTSIALAVWIGLPGVIIGTILSNLFLHFYAYPKYTYEMSLELPREEYVKLFCRHLVLFALIWLGLYPFMNLLVLSSNLTMFLVRGCVVIVAIIVVYLLLYAHTDAGRYWLELLRKALRKFRKH